MTLLDTDHFTVMANEGFTGHERLSDRLRRRSEPAHLPVIVVDEQLQGWLARIHKARSKPLRIESYDRFIKLLLTLRKWQIERWDDQAATQFHDLRTSGVRIPSQDLRIASIARTRDALLLTRNARDFSRVPGLRFESWLD